MEKLLKFEEYLFDLIFENKKELPILLSNRLKDILADIDHPIASELMSASFNGIYSKEATVIDYDDEKVGNFTFMVPGKVLDYAEKNELNFDSYFSFNNFIIDNPEYWKLKQRTSISIGKLVRKLFPGKFETPPKKDKDDVVRNYIEEFTNLVIAQREKLKNVFERFKVVRGQDIVKYYLEDNYDYTEGTSHLGASCMKYSKCAEFTEFYAVHDVEMVVLMSEKKEDKIIGRAILWKIAEINDDEVDRKFMDRIYTVKDSYIDVFKEYAKTNGWLYKYKQNMDEDEYIVDSKTGAKDNWILKTHSNFDEVDYYPYMDTMKFFYYEDGFLTNSNRFGSMYYRLDDTDGGPVNFWSDDEDSDIHVPYYDEYYSSQYVEDHMVWSDEVDSHILYDEAVQSNYYDRYGSYIPLEDSHEFFDKGEAENDSMKETIEFDNTDFVMYYDANDFIKYEYEDKTYYFHPDDRKHFVLCKSLHYDGNVEVWAHKKWDKDKIFKWKGEWWFNDSIQKKYDDLVGQLRMFDFKM